MSRDSLPQLYDLQKLAKEFRFDLQQDNEGQFVLYTGLTLSVSGPNPNEPEWTDLVEMG